MIDGHIHIERGASVLTSSDADCPEDVGYKIKELSSLIESS